MDHARFIIAPKRFSAVFCMNCQFASVNAVCTYRFLLKSFKCTKNHTHLFYFVKEVL